MANGYGKIVRRAWFTASAAVCGVCLDIVITTRFPIVVTVGVVFLTGVKTGFFVVAKAGFIGIFGEDEAGVLFHAGVESVGIAGPVCGCLDRAACTVKAGVVFATFSVTIAAVFGVRFEVDITGGCVDIAFGFVVVTEAFFVFTS